VNKKRVDDERQKPLEKFAKLEAHCDSQRGFGGGRGGCIGETGGHSMGRKGKERRNHRQPVWGKSSQEFSGDESSGKINMGMGGANPERGQGGGVGEGEDNSHQKNSWQNTWWCRRETKGELISERAKNDGRQTGEVNHES